MAYDALTFFGVTMIFIFILVKPFAI